MQQTSLFNTDSDESGFRLDYMEVYNWGTFDKEVYRICPNGNNSLLTGANASGKSTWVDALLTILVPLKRKRFYNQSSGVSKKGDRTEESYFYGNYGNQQAEGSSVTTSLRLRDNDSYSVILASFANVDYRRLTLFQVRYCAGDELRTVYGYAYPEVKLSISEDFMDFDPKGRWRRRLDRQYNTSRKHVVICDGPVEYCERMCTLLGLRSDKALSLFNQILGVKVLDDLDQFIRANMLEEFSAEDEYVKLKDTFLNLMEAKENIEKAKEQIIQLSAIDKLANDVEKKEKRIAELEDDRSNAMLWFAERGVMLCDRELEIHKDEIDILDKELAKLESAKATLAEERDSLKREIDNDKDGIRLRELKKEIKEAEKEKQARRDNADRYCGIAQALELSTVLDASAFDNNRKKSKEEERRLRDVMDNELVDEQRMAQNLADRIEKEIADHIDSIRELERQRNNISGTVAQIREDILRHTGATTTEMPFVGELIRVKSDEKEWEASIEKILHNFALRLIVPDKYYHEVSEYVNGNDLRGRIVYQRYNRSFSLKNMDYTGKDNLLVDKIEFKPDSEYSDWIADVIASDYNYVCVQDMSDFYAHSEKAVTREGLIKSTKNRHEKDDRPEVSRRENYVLGWDNRKKIKLLKEEVNELHVKQKNNMALIEGIRERKARCRQHRDAFLKLINSFSSFDMIDWESCARAIQDKIDRRTEIEKANDKMKILQKQLDSVVKEIDNIDGRKTELHVKKHELAGIIDKIAKHRKDNDDTLKQFPDVGILDMTKKYTQLEKVDFGNIDKFRKDFNDRIVAEINFLSDKKKDSLRDMGNRMYKFKNPPEEIFLKYKGWKSDVSALSEDVRYVSEYRALLSRLLSEGLVVFEERFSRYLRETVTHNVNAFRLFFQKWELSITDAVKQLNDSLYAIDFNTSPVTYIQLVASRNLDIDTKEFCRMLNEAIPNIHNVDSSIDVRKTHFEQHIVPLIAKLEDEQWRTKVMDVRNWFRYKAEEYIREGNIKRQTYESMGQLSGGEKAQLTYTILGSAIAYQFGLTKTGMESSFRFIAIDEAFKAQDEDKARYLLSLCRQLHLQLLVVTPSDNIHIVENDISFVHYVERTGHRSVIIDMPISQVKKLRAKIKD